MWNTPQDELFLVLVSIFAQLLLAFVGGDFAQLSFSSAGHFGSP